MTNDSVICAIHQPNFFPWLGYFDKIRKADVFVFLDNVFYPRSGSKGMGSWMNRVKININNSPSWITCPVERNSTDANIADVRISSHNNWKGKLLKTLQQSYSKRHGYKKAMSFLEPVIMNNTENLAEYNINAVKSICQVLRIKARFVKQSELEVKGSATELLINITKKVGANVYLCGGGAAEYQKDELFPVNSLELKYQNYKLKPYGEAKYFLPGLSVLDFLMNGDWNETAF